MSNYILSSIIVNHWNGSYRKPERVRIKLATASGGIRTNHLGASWGVYLPTPFIYNQRRLFKIDPFTRTGYAAWINFGGAWWTRRYVWHSSECLFIPEADYQRLLKKGSEA